MMKLPVLLMLLLCMALPTLAKQLPAPPVAEARSASERLEDRVLELTNIERTKRGLTPLKLNTNLREAARWMARNMAENGYFDHKDKKGRNIDPRLPDFGYKRYRLIAENIAGGQTTPEAVVAGWMKSPGHRANILNPDLREIGVGYFFNKKSKFRRYWVQDFGTRFEDDSE